jgi:hypothetical protein
MGLTVKIRVEVNVFGELRETVHALLDSQTLKQVLQDYSFRLSIFPYEGAHSDD